ncbi:tumor protein p53-inducible protein 11 isoform X1 [Sphaerodactylus townsendi]|uniref:tumor protein p53-inducible protein 11 isoform X1 n=1 Tax=Sphaerodactylus townsendi TaxID=933632 RepID=UPI002025F0C3|nr:tumor protein p53-inducible protein 11 isoform X1 [Sphaerodactylus townsendi]
MTTKQPPPLMKKHSQTDLVSRLKTRKILGVGGEDDDGEVHRSKISQVLGNEIKFAMREPLGLRVWQFVSAIIFSGIAIMALTFPDQLYDAVFEEESVNSKTPIRLYGGALLSISLIMWNALYTAEKVIIDAGTPTDRRPCYLWNTVSWLPPSPWLRLARRPWELHFSSSAESSLSASAFIIITKLDADPRKCNFEGFPSVGARGS